MDLAESPLMIRRSAKKILFSALTLRILFKTFIVFFIMLGLMSSFAVTADLFQRLRLGQFLFHRIRWGRLLMGNGAIWSYSLVYSKTNEVKLNRKNSLLLF